MSNDFAINVMKEAAKVAENPESQTAFEAEMQRRSERARMIDEKCDQAMEVMNVCLGTIQKALVGRDATIGQIIDLTEQAAKLGGAMANLRMCMNNPNWTGGGYIV